MTEEESRFVMDYIDRVLKKAVLVVTGNRKHQPLKTCSTHVVEQVASGGKGQSLPSNKKNMTKFNKTPAPRTGTTVGASEAEGARKQRNAGTDNAYEMVEDGDRVRIMVPLTVVKATGFKSTLDGCNIITNQCQNEPKPWPQMARRPSPEMIVMESVSAPASTEYSSIHGLMPTPVIKPQKTNREVPHATNSGKVENVPSTATVPNTNVEYERWANTNTRRVLTYHEPLQLIGPDRNTRTTMPEVEATHKNPLHMPIITLTRKGRIQLTPLPYQLDNPIYFDDRREVLPTPRYTKLRNTTKFLVTLPVCCLITQVD